VSTVCDHWYLLNVFGEERTTKYCVGCGTIKPNEYIRANDYNNDPNIIGYEMIPIYRQREGV